MSLDPKQAERPTPPLGGPKSAQAGESAFDSGGSVIVPRAQADMQLRAYGAVVAMAAGSALGAPWSLVRAPASDDPITMAGRPGLPANSWSEVMHPAICLLEAFNSVRLDKSEDGYLQAVREDYARRLVAWYRTQPAEVNSGLQLVLNDVTSPDAYLVKFDPSQSHGSAAGRAGGGAGGGTGGVVGAGAEESAAAQDPVGDSDSTPVQTPTQSFESKWAERLEQVARARFERTRLGFRFADNHTLPLAVVVGVVAPADPHTAAQIAEYMSITTTAHPLSVAATKWLAAFVSLCVAGTLKTPPAAQRSTGDETRFAGSQWRETAKAALEIVEADEETLHQLRAAIDLGGEAGAGISAPSAVSRLLAALETATWEVSRNTQLQPLSVAVDSSVRAGGDTETVAALVAGVCGAVVGQRGIPAHWTTDLHGWPGMKVDSLRDLVAGAI
ncbi:MAG: ADP-ribosylglycohydrolase family protein [Actinomycetaceae bacterium]|nr:ADP-ribosylglycohydrolase family protein [Actinomycetaceae bacterium]